MIYEDTRLLRLLAEHQGHRVEIIAYPDEMAVECEDCCTTLVSAQPSAEERGLCESCRLKDHEVCWTGSPVADCPCCQATQQSLAE